MYCCGLAKYLAGDSGGIVVVVVVGVVERGDDDGDADVRLSGGVHVLARHCHLSTATAPTSTPAHIPIV